MCVIRLDDLPSWFQTRFEGGGSLFFLGSPGPTCVLRAGGLSAEMKLDPSQYASRLYCASAHRYIIRVDRIR